MKQSIRVICIAMVLSFSALAQESKPETSGSGLQLETRTDEERCDFLLEVARVYVQEENYQSAINAYKRILQIDPKNKQARYILGHVYISNKQYAEAEVSLKELIQEFPDDFQLKNNLAWLYATAEDPTFRDGQKAIAMAHEAMVLAPNDHHVWSTLAEAYYVSGEYEKAYRAIKQMAALASRYGTDITKEDVEGYNEQIRKCKRAWETQKALDDEEDSE